jgi:hypothetical protein
MWERCDHAGTRIEGTPAAVVLAPKGATIDGSTPPSPADYAAWLARLGSAVVLPCPPDQCTDAHVVLAEPGKPLSILTPAGWLPMPMPRPAPSATPTPGLDFTPVAPPPVPAAPDAIALDPLGRCWLLDRIGRRLLLLTPDFRVQAVVPIPHDITPNGFACSAYGLVVSDLASPRLVVQPTDYGFKYAALRRPITQADINDYVRMTLFVAPFHVLVPSNNQFNITNVNVPIDDTHTMWHFVAHGGIEQEEYRRMTSTRTVCSRK